MFVKFIEFISYLFYIKNVSFVESNINFVAYFRSISFITLHIFLLMYGDPSANVMDRSNLCVARF